MESQKTQQCVFCIEIQVGISISYKDAFFEELERK